MLFQTKQFQRIAAASAVGTTERRRLHERDFLHLVIDLPPLAEQRRIVDLIWAVDEAHDAAAELKQAASGAWLAWADDCWANTTDEVQLRVLGHCVTGATPSTGNAAFWQSREVPFFAPSDFNGSPIVNVASRGVSFRGADSVRLLPAWSVAQVCIGATYGKVSVLGTCGCTNQQINALVGLDEIDAVTAMAMLATEDSQSRLRSIVGMTTLPIVKKSAWQAMAIRWPERNDRETLHGIVATSAQVAEGARRELDALASLRAALLTALLTRERTIPASYDRFLNPAA